MSAGSITEGETVTHLVEVVRKSKVNPFRIRNYNNDPLPIRLFLVAAKLLGWPATTGTTGGGKDTFVEIKRTFQ